MVLSPLISESLYENESCHPLGLDVSFTSLVCATSAQCRCVEWHQKADLVRSLRQKYGPFAMVGDGVNDSPALAQADVGISLLDGADIARAAADVVLMEEGLHLLLPAIDICRDGMALVRQNFSLVAGANTLALALAVPSGLMSPMVCTLISNGSGLLATLNAMRPLLVSHAKPR